MANNVSGAFVTKTAGVGKLGGANPTQIRTGLKSVVSMVFTLLGSVAPGLGTSTFSFVQDGAKAITGITQAAPGVVTSNGHGFLNDELVFITGVLGMVQVNTRHFKVAGVTTNTFTLVDPVNGSPINTTSFGAYTSGGVVDRVVNDVVNVYGWMPTGAGNPTLIASTGVEQFSWVAYGNA